MAVCQGVGSRLAFGVPKWDSDEQSPFTLFNMRSVMRPLHQLSEGPPVHLHINSSRHAECDNPDLVHFPELLWPKNTPVFPAYKRSHLRWTQSAGTILPVMTASITPAAQASASAIPSAFSVYDSKFYDILGPSPKLELLLENNAFPFAHEASVYIPSTESLFVSSNIITDPVTMKETIKVSKVNVGANPVTAEIINSTIPMANGGVNNADGILWCGQGTFNRSAGLYQMSAQPPYESELVISNFYGREFNSVNDVVVHSDGSYWFTDPIYAWRQGFRPKPKLPNQVYRYDPATNNVRVMADGFGRPNGITFSPDEKTVYITDTAETNGDGSEDLLKPATM